MELDIFFQEFYKELEQNPNLYPYYKLNHGSIGRQQFRKAYFKQRLEYIDYHIDKSSQPAILDCGCGYGTTCLYLAMNGIKTKGTTLEYYYDHIESRKKYWSQYGDSSLFSYVYENLFDNPPASESLDYIILQDTLHHIEPIKEGLQLFYNALKKGGKLILIDINGNALMESLIFFLKRGNKRVIEFYDEKLQKNITMGNENFRSEKGWRTLFEEAGFKIDEESINYIRLFLPLSYNANNLQQIIEKEQRIVQKYPLLKKYGFFGLNMVVEK
jgi:Methyltransferase domain.